LKVVVVVMAPRSEVGWRGYRMLKGKDPRDAETFRPTAGHCCRNYRP
jgi:Ni,Fe-hydrogenase I large subunit